MGYTIVGGGQGGPVTLGSFSLAMGGLNSTATEGSVQRPIRTAGTFYQYRINVDAAGTGRSVQLRKNGANANLLVSMTDATGGQFADITHNDHFAVGDTVDVLFNGSSNAFTIDTMNLAFLADTGTAGIYANASGTITSSAFTGIGGVPYATSESGTQYLLRAPGTAKNLVISVPVALSATQTFVIRKNGVSGNNTVSVSSAVTGIFEDTTHTDSFVSGDLYGVKVTPGSSSGRVTTGITIDHSTVASEVPSGSTSWNPSGVAVFYPMLPGSIGNFPNENQAQNAFGIDGVLSNLRVRLFLNTATATSTFNFRKNGANGNEVLNIASGATGTFEDTTNTDVFVSTDVLNYQFSGASVTGNLQFGIAITLTAAPLFSWYEILNEPVRKRLELPAGEQQFIAGPPAFPQVPFSWFRLMEDPAVRAKPRLREGLQQFVAFPAQPPLVSFSWYGWLGDPVRVKPPLLADRQQFVAFPPQPPIVSFSWYDWLGDPVRIKPGLLAALQQFIAFPPQPPLVSFSWYGWLPEPVRVKPGLPAGEQQFAAFPAQPPVVPFSWYGWLPEPVRVKPRLPEGEQQFIAAFNPNPFVPFSWYGWLGDPVRVKPGLRAALQQSFTTDTTVIPVSRLIEWFAPYRDPVRIKPGLEAALQMTVAWPPRLLPTANIIGILNAIETKDVMLAGGRAFNPPVTVKIGLIENSS